MAKRTTIFAAVFAALLSVTISVQAADLDYYWVGGGANNNYWTNTNWRIGSTTGTTPAEGSMNDTANSITAYILNAPAEIKFDYDRLGDAVVRLNLGQAGNTDTAVLNRAGQLLVQNGKTLAIGDGGTLNFTPSSDQHKLYIYDGGTLSITGGKLKYSKSTYNTTFEVQSGGTLSVSGGTLESDAAMNVAGTMTVSGGTFNVTNDITVSEGGSFTYTAGAWNYANALSVTGGTFTFNNSGVNLQSSNAMNVSAGTFTVQAANSFRIGQSADATVTISGGEFTSNAKTYVGINPYNGTITQSDGSATFNNELSLGWGNNASGTYNLSGGTLTTTGKAGLCNYGASKVNTFNMTGGTANFNQAGESFTIGMDSTAATANAFNLNSGTVNAADTFAIQYGGTLFVAKNGETGGNGVLNAKAITLTNNGHLNMSSGTINVGEGGIASSDGSYSITLSGGTFGTNGSSWSSGLNATISSDVVTFSPDEGKSITWSGVLSGAGGVTKAGAGTLELTGANTYAGKTTISNGTVKLSGSGKLASSVIDVETGSTLTYYNTTPQNTSPLTFNVNGGTLEFYNDTVTTNAHNQNNAICPGTSNADVTIYGTGGTLLIDGGGHVGVLNGKNSTVTISMDKNSTIYVKDGYFMNGGYTMQNWSNNQAELKIGSTGIVNLWDGQQMKVGGLTGEAGAQMIDTQTSGQGISVGNGVTSDQSFTYNGTINLSGKNFEYVGAGKQTLNGDITNAKMYSKGGTLILGVAGNDMKINTGVLIKEDGGEVQVDGNLIVESDIFRASGTWSTGNGTITLKSGSQMRVGGTMGPTIGVKLDGGLLFNDGDNGGKDATVSSPITVLSDSQLQSGWSGSLTLTGALSGSGGLTVNNDSGITYFKGTGSGNYTGSLTIIGNVRIGDTNTAAVDASTYIGKGEIILKSVSNTRGIFMNNDNHLTFANNLNVSQDSYLQAGWSKSMTFTGNIKGSGRFEVLSDSGWIIMGTHSANNEFTGDVQTNYSSSSSMGQLRLAADQPFGANAGAGYIYGKLDMNGFSQTFKGLSSDADKGPIYNDSTTLSTLTLDTTGKDLTFKSSINGNIALVIKGTGTQTLSKTPGHTGSTTLESGTLVLSAGGTLYNLSGAGDLNYGSNALVLNNSEDTTFSGSLSGSGKVTFQNGSGWIELGKTADESFTGDVQLNYANSDSQGRVRLGADNALGTANRAYVYGSLDMNGHNQSFAGLSDDADKGPIFNETDALSTLTIDNISEDLTFHSSIAGNVALVLTGTETGKLTLTKAPEYTGSTTIETGTLALTNGGTLYNLSGGNLDAGGQIAAEATLDATGKDLTFVNSETTKFIGSIKANNIVKDGDGTLQIYAASEGQVDAGSFLVSSGRLDMKEYYNGTMQVKSGATMSPGNSVGTLTIDGAFILDSAATLLIEQDGSGMDKLIAGSFTVSPDSVLELTYGGGSGSYDILVQNDGDFTGDYATDSFWNSLLTPGSDYYWNISVNGNVVTATIDPNAVPEPSTWALLILGVGSLTATRGSGASSCISKNHLPNILQEIQFSANSSSVTWGLIPNANSLTCSIFIPLHKSVRLL